MFGVNREQLIGGLKNLRNHICSYMNCNRCDCKYGAHVRITPLSEQGCGCPEVGMALTIIGAMTAVEFKIELVN